MAFDEILYMLAGACTAAELNEKREDIAVWLPLVRTMFGYDQKNHAHQYDLWMHSLYVTVGLPKGLEDDMLYLAALLHDIGKPLCQVVGKREGDTDMHYYGHPEKSAELVKEEVLPQLMQKGIHISEAEQNRLLYYVRYHDDHVSCKPKHLKRHLELLKNEVLGNDYFKAEEALKIFQKLMFLQVSDAKVHVQKPVIAQRVEICSRLSDWKELLELYRMTAEVYGERMDV